jgi:hypothetical protein
MLKNLYHSSNLRFQENRFLNWTEQENSARSRANKGPKSGYKKHSGSCNGQYYSSRSRGRRNKTGVSYTN